ncbi:ataxin-7-like, partial [Nannospalax galili]|uniref:ataxin-7-like n=1 Tax=Nannospalax galili TaxID=1026970 RepID=UPI00111C1A1A
MSERAADDVRGESRRAAGGAAAARQHQLQPPQPQRQPPRRPRPEDGGPGAASSSAAAMATLWERRPLPSPEAMLGQPWNLWVEASKLPGKDGTELDESLKEFGKNREVMGLCREGESSPDGGVCANPREVFLLLQPTFPASPLEEDAEEEGLGTQEVDFGQLDFSVQNWHTVTASGLLRVFSTCFASFCHTASWRCQEELTLVAALWELPLEQIIG